MLIVTAMSVCLSDLLPGRSYVTIAHEALTTFYRNPPLMAPDAPWPPANDIDEDQGRPVQLKWNSRLLDANICGFFFFNLTRLCRKLEKS